MRPEPHIPGPYGAVRIAAIVAALGLVFWAGQQRFDGIELAGVSLPQLAELLAVYLFLALLVERAVELVLNWRFGRRRSRF